jgi:CHAT domain-containing protein
MGYIPFGALPEPGEGGTTNSAPGEDKPPAPLLVKHEIVSLPSASVLMELRKEVAARQRAPKSVAVLADPVFDAQDSRVARVIGKKQLASSEERGGGDFGAPILANSLAESRLTRSATEVGFSGALFPRLVFSRREADTILAATPAGQGREELDFQASRAAATSAELSQYRIVHFATHGLLDSAHPELSGLVLSMVDEQGREQNGFVDLQDIYNLNLPADLVVLSACETGLGKDVKGEGLVGLTRGFMYAGATRVVASLWKVDDVATSKLMGKFYEAMLSQGRRPAEALREAQIEMWKQKRWSYPYYWAAFVLQGEWR